MAPENNPLWIGDRYSWGTRYERNSTLIAGFFYDEKRNREIIALTITPPPGYLDEYQGIIDVIDGLTCLVKMPGSQIDKENNHADIYHEISQTIALPKSRCHLIGLNRQRIEASFIGSNRAVILGNSVRRGLYELETESPVTDMAGAPVICDGLLSGLIVADGGQSGDHFRAFAVSTQPLAGRLCPMASVAESDRLYSNDIVGKIAAFEKTRSTKEETFSHA